MIMKTRFILTIALAIHITVSSAQTLRHTGDYSLEINHCEVSRLMIIDSSLLHIIDSVVIEYKRCPTCNSTYPWIISTRLDCVKDRENMYCIEISQSLFSDATEEGYGFFYYKGALFIVMGVQCPGLFKKTKTKKVFRMYKDVPVFIFDPPRWLYVYDGRCFFQIHKSPCGG